MKSIHLWFLKPIRNKIVMMKLKKDVVAAFDERGDVQSANVISRQASGQTVGRHRLLTSAVTHQPAIVHSDLHSHYILLSLCPLPLCNKQTTRVFNPKVPNSQRDLFLFVNWSCRAAATKQPASQRLPALLPHCQ